MRTVVFCPNWIGDVAMATPALRALRTLDPGGTLVGLMRPYVAETLAGNPWLDETILYDHHASDPDQRTLAVVRQLRRQRIDSAVLLTNSFRSAMLARLGGARRRIGYARDGRGLLLTDRLRPKKDGRRYVPTPVLDDYLALAARAGASDLSPKMELFTTTADETAADETLAALGFAGERPLVTLNPGAAFGAAKRWPTPYFASLARRLADQRDADVLVLCGPAERGIARGIADLAARPRQVRSLAERPLSLGQSKALVRRSRLLVSTDSGPRHFGVAFGVPTVSLFGPTHQQWTLTRAAHETMLQRDLPCGPCQQRTCPLGHLRCMNELTVDEVFAAACGRLDRMREAA